MQLSFTQISEKGALTLYVDVPKSPIFTIYFKFSTDSLTGLSLHSLTISVLSPEIVCVVDKGLENICIYLHASRNQNQVE